MRKPLTDTGAILAVPVVLHLYDTTGDTKTKILADSGTTTAEMESFEIWGDVYVKTRDDLVIRSERLELDYETHQWHSDTFVEIRTAKGDVMRGKGFDAREDFSHSSFRSRVSGRFPQFRERLGEDELF
ncbi:MAG: LPS export ABC transporter periplasmic protein LptC [Chitinivibrionales bacterium]|nr:LPS export ABC transporter periplasmic protein LptC [Chitinivibrionales bacterium]